jgi:Zn-dependent peptidase ImmA (M78 family)
MIVRDRPFNPSILDAVLRARALSKRALADRIGESVDSLDAELGREPEPKQTLLNKIADELRVPAYIFYMETIPDIQEVIPDFRTQDIQPRSKSKETLRALQLAESVQKVVRDNKPVHPADLLKVDIFSSESVEREAIKAREHFNITMEDQFSTKSAGKFYVRCRRNIEQKGIFVLHLSFPSEDGSGFCLYDEQYPIIVANTRNQTIQRRLFTLVHELGHVLIERSGISDPFKRSNYIEAKCNEFAGSFLLPVAAIQYVSERVRVPVEPSIEDVQRVAAKFKVSQQATSLRLEKKGFVKAGSHDRWLAHVSREGNPDYYPKRGGSGETPQEKIKLSYYGFRFANAFDRLLRDKRLSALDIYRVSGLKPKYQKKYTPNLTKSEDLGGL